MNLLNEKYRQQLSFQVSVLSNIHTHTQRFNSSSKQGIYLHVIFLYPQTQAPVNGLDFDVCIFLYRIASNIYLELVRLVAS